MNRTGRLVSFKVAVLLTAVMIASCGGGSSGSGGNDLSGDGSNGGQSNPPVLTVPSDAFVFTVDVASTNTVAGSGGTPASCSIAGLPAGLTATVAGNGCAISGTATSPLAQSSYTLSARNDDGTATITIDLSVIDPPVLTVPSNAFVFTVDVASTNTVAGSGGTPASCSVDGLPAGLSTSVAGNGCVISGIATSATALSSYTLTATNNDGTATITIDLSVIDPPVLTVPSNAFVFTLDVASTNTIAGSGGTPASCSIAGLPAGLTATVAGNGCAISGTATASSTQRSYTLSARNDDGTATITIDLSVIIVPPVLAVLAVPSDAFVFTLDVASTNTVAGSGSAPTSCSIANLPAGLTATVAGNGCAISGTATTPLAQSSYILSASNAAGTSTTTIEILIPVDRDANGLIELYTLTQLHNMRYNLSGSSYKTSTADTGSTTGCPNDACNGYELMNEVEFDTDGDGQSWTQDSSGNYSLDSGDSAAPYFVIDSSGSGGWQPVGDSNNAFNAIFDGNGYVIRNLAIRRELTDIGLFGVTAANAVIRNVGLVNNLSDYTGSSRSNVGGLVGFQQFGSINASYATGNADGGAGDRDYVGGLVGGQRGGSIRASYATGNADGGDGDEDFVGGLVGYQEFGSIRASYATGNADGGDGTSDSVGGLVGSQNNGNITASYATGDADGGAGVGDTAGGLVGLITGGGITASYSFGSAIGEVTGIDGTGKPTGVTSAAGLTAANVGSSWNSASSSTLGAWDFGGGAQPPAVVFNDYDGVSTGTDYAALFAGYTTLTALIPNQRPASSPQIGTATTDIRLNDGDTANSISGNIDLPATFNGENLTWSVFYDPAPTDSQVSVDNNNSVQVNAAHRSTARTFILRAVDSNSNIVNDYHLRIIE